MNAERSLQKAVTCRGRVRKRNDANKTKISSLPTTRRVL